jgi:inner membrane protein
MVAARAYRPGRAPRWRSIAWWSILSLLPDADVIGFPFGVQYGDPWGHRGATHSLTFAIMLGLVVGLTARRFHRPFLRTTCLASAVLASHALLDTMTDGGLGCALLWPFDLARYFAPWRPIPVAPIGLAFLSPAGGFIALTELVLFAPALLLALRSPTSRIRLTTLSVLLGVWLVAIWLIASGDVAREAVVGFVLREDTAYAAGFSEPAFRAVTPGAPASEVKRLLGVPLAENWIYSPRNQPFQPAPTRAASSLAGECLVIRFEAGVVATALDRNACDTLGIKAGIRPAQVERLLGSPPESCWRYSRSSREGHYRMRMVCFLNGNVETIFRRWD